MRKKKTFILISSILALIGLVLSWFGTRKNLTFVVDGEAQNLTSHSLRVGDLLRVAEVEIREGDKLNPPANHWLQDGDTVTLERANHVVISADNETHTLLTTERIPSNLLALAGVLLYPGDQLQVEGVKIDPSHPLSIDSNIVIKVRRAHRITVREGDETHSFLSSARTLGEALWEEGIVLRSADHLVPPANTPLENGSTQATLVRSKEVKVYVQGDTIQARSTATTVGGALADIGLSLQGLDYSFPPENRPLTNTMEINVVRVREEISIEQEPLPFETRFQPLPDVELDNQRVVQVGEYGIIAKRVRVLSEADPSQGDWVEISRQVENEWVAREPKPRLIGYGTNVVVRRTNTPDGTIRYWRAVDVFASSYSPCRSGVPNKCYPNTSSGKPVVKGVIAVTLSWYRYMQGMRVYIPGYGFATIEDVGGGLPGQHWIDLGYSDEDWVGWGQNVTLYFLAPVPNPERIMWILD